MTAPQIEILRIDERDERCWDVEGSPRAAKSWGVGFWIWKLAYQYPGIQIFYCRYKDEGLAQLRDVWSKVSIYFPTYLHPKWNTADQTWDFPNGEWVGEVYTGSRVLLSSLKVSEAGDSAAIHGKYKGKTLAVVIIEEAQEVPKANYVGLKERLSQSRTPTGQPFRYPLKIVLVHNCVDEDHWISEEFPLSGDGNTCTRDGHAHIRADLYSNAPFLGPDVMMGYERDYPPGHTLRRTVIEGRRGVTLIGTPVYAGYFDRTLHVDRTLDINPYYPLLEGWDFGHEKPAVVWWQYLANTGAIRILGAVKGSALYLETFAPKALEIRRRWFPTALDVWSWCDPTGATGNQGMEHTAIRLLHNMGVPARFDATANNASVRYGAIQVIGGYMERAARDGSPAFLVNPRTIEVVKDGATLKERMTDLILTSFEAGYIWDEHAAPDTNPNVRKPKKGTRYDDLMNAGEYIVIGERISKPLQQEMWAADKRMAATAQRVASAAIAASQRPAQVGVGGETMVEATARIVRAAKMATDHDPADHRYGKGKYRKVAGGGRRGGW